MIELLLSGILGLMVIDRVRAARWYQLLRKKWRRRHQ